MKHALVAIALAGCGGGTALTSSTNPFDLDGDGVGDCWHVRGDAVKLQPSCTGDWLDVAPDPLGRIVLPQPVATRAWAIAIGDLLVGGDHVECEAPGPDCTGDAPALAGEVQRKAPVPPYPSDIRARYTPRWYDGVPVAYDEAFVLDPSARRGEPFDEGSLFLGGESLIVRRVGPTPLGGLGGCDTWGLMGGMGGVIAVDRANGRWTWMTTDRVANPYGDAPACIGDLVVVIAYTGIDWRFANAFDPRTGVELETSAEGQDARMYIAGDRRGRSGTPTLRQIAALAATPADELAHPDAPCAEPATTPLVAMPDGPPCTLHGKADVDGRAPLDCWTAQRDGSREAGTLSWDVGLQYGCRGDPQKVSLTVGSPVARVDIADLTRPAQRWLAREIGGDRAGCLPARAGCPAPPPAARWADERFTADRYMQGRVPLTWQDGAPALEPPSAVLDERGEDPTLLVYRAASEEIPGTPPSKTWSCDRWEVWTAPAGAAIVDRRTHRWAWVYLAIENDLLFDRPPPVVSGRCNDRSVVLQLADKQEVTVDPASGAWSMQ